MRAWTSPVVPRIDLGTAGPVRVHDTATGAEVETAPDGGARMYVCGITPYDATHIGHAATYIGFDLLNRAWRDAGHAVHYTQNVTDVDDPLLERATATGMDWVELAERETELFRTDMTALRVLAPDDYVGAVESIPLVVEMVAAAPGARRRLRGRGGPVLRGPLRPALRLGVAPDRRADAGGLRRARRRPRPLRQEGPAGLPALAARARGRAGLGLRARPRTPRLAHRVLGDRAGAPRAAASTSRAAAATWSSRTTR